MTLSHVSSVPLPPTHPVPVAPTFEIKPTALALMPAILVHTSYWATTGFYSSLVPGMSWFRYVRGHEIPGPDSSFQQHSICMRPSYQWGRTWLSWGLCPCNPWRSDISEGCAFLLSPWLHKAPASRQLAVKEWPSPPKQDSLYWNIILLNFIIGVRWAPRFSSSASSTEV